MMSSAALREVFQLQNQADSILKQATISRADAKRADLLIARMAAIRSAGLSADEQRAAVADEQRRVIGINDLSEQRTHETLFKEFLCGAKDKELEKRATTFVAGTQQNIFTAGPQGGV